MITKCPNCQMTFADNAMMRHNCRRKEDLVDTIADFMHMQWSHWQKHVHSQMIKENVGEKWYYMTLSEEQHKYWERQMNTPYSELTEKEKDSDREWAIKLLELLMADGDIREVLDRGL